MFPPAGLAQQLSGITGGFAPQQYAFPSGIPSMGQFGQMGGQPQTTMQNLGSMGGNIGNMLGQLALNQGGSPQQWNAPGYGFSQFGGQQLGGQPGGQWNNIPAMNNMMGSIGNYLGQQNLTGGGWWGGNQPRTNASGGNAGTFGGGTTTIGPGQQNRSLTGGYSPSGI